MRLQKYKSKKIIISILILIFVNLPYVSDFLLNTIDINHFRYSNANGSFIMRETFSLKSGIYDRKSMEWMNKSLKHKEVYRLYIINPLCFWRWRYYLNYSIQFRYKNWEDIEAIREPYIYSPYDGQRNF